MMIEAIAAFVLGALLLWLALGALGTSPRSLDDGEFDPIEDTPRGQALLALKDLDFDRETGKIAEDDYAELKTRLSLEAVRVIEREKAVAPAPAGSASPPAAASGLGCRQCGPRPEPDAVFCSRCGNLLTPPDAAPASTPR